MTALNAFKRGQLQQALRDVNRELIAQTKAITGADSDAVKNAAGVLRSTWRDLLKNRSDEPSAPGEPPRAKTTALRRSINHGIVDGVRRVGSSLFTSRLLEFGVFSDRLVIEPRPHARPALEAAAPKMTDVMVTTLQQRIAAGAVTK